MIMVHAGTEIIVVETQESVRAALNSIEIFHNTLQISFCLQRIADFYADRVNQKLAILVALL